jgi:hypothetical protein
MARGLERDRSHRGQEEAVTLARRWIDAWQSNRLTRLLSLFDDDGSYVNTILKISACGKRELGGPFGRMLHDRRSAVEMTGAAFDGIADDLVVTCDDDWSGLSEALQQIPFDYGGDRHSMDRRPCVAAPSTAAEVSMKERPSDDMQGVREALERWAIGHPRSGEPFMVVRGQAFSPMAFYEAVKSGRSEYVEPFLDYIFEEAAKERVSPGDLIDREIRKQR